MPEPLETAGEEPTAVLAGPNATRHRPPLQIFRPGDLAAERFRIAAVLGQGGMGQVYRAEDLELGQEVALKVLRPELAGDPMATARFRSEVRLARLVTHTNVCRVFDVFTHAGEPSVNGAAQQILLAMELLAGETLTARIRRQPLDAEAAIEVARQLAEGIDAAHRAGVVHLDLKAGNVFLEARGLGSTPRSKHPLRVVITDFGIARAAADSGRSLADWGTRRTMAPEQCRGAEVGAPADIYAFGIILLDMLVAGGGDRIFPGDSEGGAAALADATSALPRGWRAVIVRCLAAEPGRRYATAGEAVARLLWSSPRQRRRRVVLRTAAAAIGLAAAAAGVGLRRTAVTERQVASVAASRPAVGMLDLEPADARSGSWLPETLTEMVAARLGAGERLRLVNPEIVADTLAGLGLQSSEVRDGAELSRLAASLGADYLLSGGVQRQDEHRIRVVIIARPRSGRPQPAIARSGSDLNLGELAESLAAGVRGALATGAVTGTALAEARSLLPESPQAVRLYTMGLRRLRRFDAIEAQSLLTQAAVIEPEHPLIHVALADAACALGRELRAREESRLALRLASRLPRRERLMIEAREREGVADWAAAEGIYKALWELFPDEGEVGLRLANAEIAAGKGRTALATLAAMRRLPARPSWDARIDLVAATAAASISSWEAERRFAVAAAEQAKLHGARLLLARARLLEGKALSALGRSREAQSVLREVEDLAAGLGDLRGSASARLELSHLKRDEGAFESAMAGYRQVREIAERIGDQHLRGTAIRNMGIAIGRRGRLSDAEAIFKEALAVFRAAGHLEGEALALNSLGLVQWQRGDLPGAHQLFLDSLKVMEQSGSQVGLAAVVGNMANLEMSRGDLRSALVGFERALAIGETIEDPSAAITLANIGLLKLELGDLAGSRRALDRATPIAAASSGPRTRAIVLHAQGLVHYEQDDLDAAARAEEGCLTVGRKLGDADVQGACLIALAAIAQERGDLQQARALAAAAHLHCQSAESAECRVSALKVLVEVSLQRRQLASGRAAIGDARRAATGCGGCQIELRIMAAELQAASGRTTAAAAALAGIAAECTQQSRARAALEARMALTRIEIGGGGDRAAVQANLRSFRRDAAARGFERYARRARLLEHPASLAAAAAGCTLPNQACRPQE